jgi:hypothetical protein
VAPSHRHHLVSRGYLRFFAKGEQLLLIDLKAHTYRPVGTRDAFVKANFNSWLSDEGWNDEVERVWHGVETDAIPAVAKLLDGETDDVHRMAAKELAALHLARSYSYDIVHKRILEQVIAAEMELAERDPYYAQLYARDAGHAFVPGELADRVKVVGEALKSQRRFFLDRMLYLFQRTREFLAPLQVQLVYAPQAMSFLTGDTPVITSDKRGFRLGFRQGLALGDTAGVFMPLGRRVGMDLRTHDAPADRELAPWEVQLLNLFVARAALGFLGCHPDDKPEALLANRSFRSTEAPIRRPTV